MATVESGIVLARRYGDAERGAKPIAGPSPETSGRSGERKGARVTVATFSKRNVDWKLAAAACGAAVAGLGGLAAWNVRQALAATRAHPRRGKLMTVDGITLHYIEAGAGKPVVLIHGIIITNRDFALDALMARLIVRGHRVIAFDRPGYGYSDRPRGRPWTAFDQAALLARACAQLMLERPVVVGHSWGTMVALALGLEHPDAVGGVVAISGCYYPTLRADVALASLVALPIVGDALRYTLAPLAARAALSPMLKTMFAPQTVPPGFATGPAAGLALRPSQLRAENEDGATMEATLDDMQHRYCDIRTPVTIMAGLEDKIAWPDRHAVKLNDAIPHSRLRLVPDTGHMLHHAAPERVVDAIEKLSAASAA